MIYSVRFKKDVLFLKMFFCFGFWAFGFEAIPHPSCYLNFIVDKIHHGPVNDTFSKQLLQLF